MSLGLDQAQAAIDRAFGFPPAPRPPLDEDTERRNREFIDELNRHEPVYRYNDKPLKTFGQHKVGFSSEAVWAYARDGDLEAIRLLDRISDLQRSQRVPPGCVAVFTLNVGARAPERHKFYDLTFKNWVILPSMHLGGVAKFRLIRRLSVDGQVVAWYFQDMNIHHLEPPCVDDATEASPRKRLLDLE